MKVASFEKLNAKDNDATAVCKMEVADGSYGVKVSWQFTFKKENDKWKAISQETKKQGGIPPDIAVNAIVFHLQKGNLCK